MSTSKRILYGNILKILGIIGLFILSYYIIRSAILPPTSQTMRVQSQSTKPITIDLSTIGQGKIHTVQWNSKNIAILHLTKAMQISIENSEKRKQKYFVFANSGGDLNCPLVVAKTEEKQLKDICSGYLYDLFGKAKTPSSRVRDLRIPPHQFLNETTLLIGDSGLFPNQ